MRLSRVGILAIAISFALPLRPLSAAESVTIANPHGGSLVFTETAEGWKWTALHTPSAPPDGWTIRDYAVELAIGERTESLSSAWELVDSGPDRIVLQQEVASLGVRVRRVFSFGASTNAARIETSLRSLEGRRLVARLGLLDTRVPGEAFRTTGAAPVSFPVFGDALFAGIEHVSGEASVVGDPADRFALQHRPRVTIEETWQTFATVVVGWREPGKAGGATPAERIREAFLQYLDSVRVKPPGIVLHTDTWWTVPLPLNEKNVLADIEALRKGFAERTGMFFDTYCVDLGWSHPQTFWRMHPERFPNELRPIDERLKSLGGRMGLWLSPGSGYADGLSNAWLAAQGYEMLPFGNDLGQVPCFALGGRYQREFKERIVAYAQQYGLGHVILDFMPLRCDVAEHGHPPGPESRYAIDAGLADVLDALRAVNPSMALEPMVCGYPPSPWWLLKTPFVLGPAGDDMPYGRGPAPDWMEALITARDIAYRTGQEAWIMPTQALETFDIIVLTPGEFQNTAVMAIGRGRWFLSTYFKAELVKPEDWDFLAALVRWARENKSLLGNAWQFGGKPEDREAYGFHFRNPAKDLYCARNPWIEPRTITLPASALAGGARDVRMVYPRREVLGRIEPGGPGLAVQLGPYETIFVEAVTAAEEPPVAVAAVRPTMSVMAGAPRVVSSARGNREGGFRWTWVAVASVPEGSNAELCIVVEGGREVSGAIGKLWLNGRDVELRRTGSSGQFGAAIDPSPENWTWFMAPLPPGDVAFQIEVTSSAEEVSIGVFVRGAVAARNDPPPESGAVFPTHRADRRGWSQTLLPVAPYAVGAQ